jgi:hypothetical protein
MKRYQIWIIHSILLIGLAGCIVFAQIGCKKSNDGDTNNYDGTKITVIDNSVYKIKVTVKYANSVVPAKFYCESIQVPSVFEFIKLINCKNFNGDLYIPYNRVLWFTYQDYNGEDE